jgi:predicted 3-demethylubiquinone-9 3-methyltransferase (glyoxalase superfamily)
MNKINAMQKITPFLWFDGKAEEATKLYTSIFKNSKIISMKYWGEGTPFPANQVMTATFELDGVQFHAFDAGPMFKFTEAISMFVDCDTQEEVDHYWNALTADGGQESQCGWLKDKFGISWQIIPKALMQYNNDKDKAKSARVFQAMMKMKKIIIADLDKAANG